jgi:hypothetical protein
MNVVKCPPLLSYFLSDACNLKLETISVTHFVEAQRCAVVHCLWGEREQRGIGRELALV